MLRRFLEAARSSLLWKLDGVSEWSTADASPASDMEKIAVASARALPG